MSVACEPFPDVGEAGKGVRPGDGFLAKHSCRAASLTVQDRTAEAPMVGPHGEAAEYAHRDRQDAGARRAAGRGSVAEQLAAVEPIVRQMCRARLGAADGDDAAQQTLLTLWRRLEAGHPIESLPAFAAGCARYEVMHTRHEFRARPTVAVGDLAEWAWADDAPGPEAHAVRAAEVAEAHARVEELLAGLTPRQAEALRATKLADQDDTDAAAAELGITASSVRSNLVRAMARLREACGTQSPNPLTRPGTAYERARDRLAAAREADAVPPRTAEQDAFAAEVRRHRETRGMSQAQLARALDTAQSHLSRIERGRTWPGSEFARRLDDALDSGDTLRQAHGRHQVTAADAATDETDVDGREVESGSDRRVDLDTGIDVDLRDEPNCWPGNEAGATDGGCAAEACATARDAVEAAVGSHGAAAEDARWYSDDHALDHGLGPDTRSAGAYADEDVDAVSGSWSR